jgi:hypothetical protein
MKSSNQLAETINAAARVGALILAIAAFAVIWETDGKSREKWVAHREKAASTYQVAKKTRRPATRRLVRKETVARKDTVVRRDAKRLPVADRAVQTQAAAQVREIPASSPSRTNVVVTNSLWSNLKMPDSMAPGNYRIVDTLGHVEFMQLGTGSAGNGPMLYTVETNGVTTFFIRLDALPTDIKTATDNKRSTRS